MDIAKRNRDRDPIELNNMEPQKGTYEVGGPFERGLMRFHATCSLGRGGAVEGFWGA